MNTGQNFDEEPIYKVVMNHEEQYSIWPGDKENPPGWSTVEKEGTRGDCLAYIEQAWIDRRPLSLRKEMDRARDVI